MSNIPDSVRARLGAIPQRSSAQKSEKESKPETSFDLQSAVVSKSRDRQESFDSLDELDCLIQEKIVKP